MHQLLVALDVPSRARAEQLAADLSGAIGGVKVGSELFTAEGPPIVSGLQAAGARVFLDLKFHDIPNTVASAVRSATRLGVWMMTLHAGGGKPMMKAAVESARDTAAASNQARPLLVGITVLTSTDQATAAELGVQGTIEDHVLRLTDLALAAGLDGVVASPRELVALRARFGPDFVIVTPGIRLDGGSAVVTRDDQARTMTPAEALARGASYLVVGRPIVAAPNPREAALHIASGSLLFLRNS
ncbi:MAG: orotidine-5'-phosphate decarboxylase [Vicinamibacterales bacterium]